MKPCTNCERQNADDAIFCDACGHGFDKYNRLGGWLLVFVIFLICSIGLYFYIINSAVTRLANYHSFSTMPGFADFYPNYFSWAIVSLVSAITFLALHIWLIIKIFRRRAGFLRLYQIMRLLGMIEYPIMLLFSYTTPGATIRRTLFDLLGLILFTIYFCLSKRVRAYMGSDAYIKKAWIKFR
ncbi:MAG: DUF2569 family protein [Clostridiales bacterium]|nr:DUF2569 family protein [Clostridiales bacterium]